MRNCNAIFPVEGMCLLRGSEKLCNDSNLRVPMLPKLKLKFSISENIFKKSSIKWQNGFRFSGTEFGEWVDGKVIAIGDASDSLKSNIRKPKRLLNIQLSENNSKTAVMMEQCDAGDSFYFAFPNTNAEISIMAERLGVSCESVNKEIVFASADEGVDCSFFLPAYVSNPCSLDYILRWCLDIRRSPSRPLLRALAEHTKNPQEQRRLLELCSVQGSEEFTKFVRMSGISLVDFLIAFPSCKPPVSLLIELVPRLQPRAYTAACYKLEWGYVLRFVYSLLLVQPAENGIQFPRYGACSGWLKNLAVGDNVQISLKEPSKFRLPPILTLKNLPMHDITTLPLIMVGPGTGIAPFIAFLEKIRYVLRKDSKKPPRVCRILFYGSSNLTEEFLFESELKEFVKEGVLTDLVLCESRPQKDDHKSTTRKPKYVQNGMKSIGAKICEYLLGNKLSEKEDCLSGGLLFACGDVKAMSKSLWACLAEILQEHQGLTPVQAMDLLKKLRVEERLIEDVWS